jgi:hypothetical protein
MPDPDDEEWRKNRILSPLDNEAMDRYFTVLATIPDETIKAKIVTEFNKALDEGERPKVAVARALKAV